MSKHIGIIGGGLLGMTLALKLREQGFQITIFEANEMLGGLAKPTQIGNYIWDQFYHVILMSDEELLDLILTLEIKDRLKWKRAKTGFLNNGSLYSMSNIIEFLNFPPLKLLDKIRLGFTIFYASRIKSPEKLEMILVKDWLKRFSGQRTFNKIWLPLLKSKLGEYYKQTNAKFIWASIDRLYKARRTGLKTEMFGYVEGGYATILDKFHKVLKDLQVRILCQRSITQIIDNNGKVKADTSTGETFEFDYVILTLPCDRIAQICPQLSEGEKNRFEKVIYEGVVCAAFIIKKGLAGYYVTNLIDGWVPFTAVIEMTAIVDRQYFEGNTLVYLPRYVSMGDPFWEKEDEEIKKEFARALERIYPHFKMGEVIASKIMREKSVFPIMTLNYSKELLPPLRTSLKHVFVVNSAQIINGTMNVNEIVKLANRKTKEIEKLVKEQR